MLDADLESRAAARLGTVLRGKYRLDAVLGIGGMSVVYAATHRNQKRFAVKVLHPALSADPEMRARFLREGYVANTVEHPGAVTVLDDDTAEDGAAFLVMELLEGTVVESLRQGGRRLPLPIVAAIADKVLSVLAAAHAKSIVHRDIKPANVFLTREGAVKLLDFGVARVRDLAGSGALATTAGALLGTPAFMAPEQAGGRPSQVDPRTDLWAVGATMFTLLSGAYVHTGETVQQIVVRAATERARSLREALPAADARAVALVDRALAYEPEDRFASASAMRDALRGLQNGLSGAPVGPAVLAGLVDGSAQAPPPSVPARTSVPVAHTVPVAVESPRPAAVTPAPHAPGPARRGPRVVLTLGLAAATAVAGLVVAGLRGTSNPPPRGGAPPALGLVAVGATRDSVASAALAPVPAPVPLPVPSPEPGSPAAPRPSPPPPPPLPSQPPPLPKPTSSPAPSLASPAVLVAPPTGATPGTVPARGGLAVVTAAPRPPVRSRATGDAGATRREGRDNAQDWDRP